jgi:prepilin-type N-terminal cleavage/methylation domain-containing protein
VYAIWSKAGTREDERGFTLTELLATIAILAILIAIAVIVFLYLLERWRVEAATRQLAGDLRRAHGSATNQLTDWRVVPALDRAEQEEAPTTTWSGWPRRTMMGIPGPRPANASRAPSLAT